MSAMPVPAAKEEIYAQEIYPTLKGPPTAFRLNKIVAECAAILPKVSLDRQANIHEILGGCHFQLGRLNDSLSHFNKAHNIDPRRRSAYGNGALTLLHLGRTYDALDRYAKLLSDETDVPVLSGMSGALAILGQLEDAQSAFENAAELARSVMDHFYVAVAAADLELHVEACEMFARAIAIERRRPLGGERSIDVINAAPPELKGCLRYRGANTLQISIQCMDADGNELLATHEVLKNIPRGMDLHIEAAIESKEVFESTAPLRERANRATFGVSDDGSI